MFCMPTHLSNHDFVPRLSHGHCNLFPLLQNLTVSPMATTGTVCLHSPLFCLAYHTPQHGLAFSYAVSACCSSSSRHICLSAPVAAHNDVFILLGPPHLLLSPNYLLSSAFNTFPYHYKMIFLKLASIKCLSSLRSLS